jgi:hypothetical protein
MYACGVDLFTMYVCSNVVSKEPTGVAAHPHTHALTSSLPSRRCGDPE